MPTTRQFEWQPRISTRIGLLGSASVFNGVKVHVPKAYPCTTAGIARRWQPSGYLGHFENLSTFGRNGLHRYNNQDHSMWTAMLATLNHTDGAAHDVWSVNTGGEYLEEDGLAQQVAELDLAI